MAGQTIVGVDFSGAKTNNTTQVTMAVLRGTILELKKCDPLPKSLPSTHDELRNRISRLPCNAVVAMDFPFSVPRLFAEELARKEEANPPSTMPDLWRLVAEPGMEFSRFKELAMSFVKRHGEVMRRGDVNFGGPFSPLHSVNPSMLQMTFYGMRMLHGLRKAGCRVPPLPDGDCSKAELLETMPGVLLRTFGLPAKNYKTKNKTNDGHPEKIRCEILVGLKRTSGVKLRIPDDILGKCISDADALDSLVAAIGAALWSMDKSENKSRFTVPRESIPPNEELQAARLEGWIYAPRKNYISVGSKRTDN